MGENTYKPRNYRIVRHVTRNRILDIQDALEIGKLRIELVDFVEGEGAKLSVEHFAEPDALALICYDLLQGRPWEKYIEFKGSVQGETVTSRVLVLERVEARNPIKITVSRGPGKLIDKGAIQPLGKPEATLSVLLSEFDARRIAFTVLRHMAAYEAATYHARVAAGTRRALAEEAAAYEPDATAAEAEWPSPVEDVEPEAAPDASAPAPVLEAAPAASAPAPVQSAPTASSRRPAPPVETYWEAAERLGLSRAEAEKILQDARGNWGQAWSVLRSRN